MGNATLASASPTHCHSARINLIPSPRVASERATSVEAVHEHSGRDHRSGEGCPSDGTCCDAFCHVFLAPSLPVGDMIHVTFASYARRTEAAMGSLPARGPERPPRPAAA